MPQANHFRHQLYTATGRTFDHHLLRPAPSTNQPAEIRRRVQAVSPYLHAAGVDTIVLVHGTFVGTDALGLSADLGRFFPSASAHLRRLTRQVAHWATDEAGNYTPAFARWLERDLSDGADHSIKVQLFDWSSENHHLGRADGAVRLIGLLDRMKTAGAGRVLLWGHSHAGNVFALLTNLLGGTHEDVRQFFDAARVYYRLPLVGWVDVPVWEQVRRLLLERRDTLRRLRLDLVTFGTPVRYGWESGGYDHLLHFVHHRPVRGLPFDRAAFPPAWENVVHGTDGDYVQQLAVAGTNVMPSMFAWRTWWADHRLRNLLEGGLPKRHLFDRLSEGVRCPDEGTALLVDYPTVREDITQHHAGHAVYTRRRWLPFHVEQIAHRFYSAPAELTHAEAVPVDA